MTIGPAFDQVLAAAQANAPWAFTRLYEDLSPAVAGYVRSQGASEPEDVTSEVFLAAFTRLRSFTGDEAAFRSWVFTIAYRRIVDHWRSRASRPQPEPLDEAVDDGRGPAGGSSAEDQALARLGTERVQQLLAQLTPDQRHVLALRVVGDLTVEQVAEAVGMEVGAVKALQRRALASLRRNLVVEGVPL